MAIDESRQSDIDRIKEKLGDKHWRMNNLYFIKDKNGKKVKFNFNLVQSLYWILAFTKNIILKARQQGFTTYACIDALDNVLFNSNYDAGIIAHNSTDAEKIFTNKVRFAYDNLPEWLKSLRVPNTDRAGELRFPNGSSISVSTGYRGGTLMQLHVSELGKIGAKFPEKAKEIISGAFNAVPLDGKITVESTAEGMNGAFFEMCEKAQKKNPEALTNLDFKFHFFAWYQSNEYRLNPEGIEIPDSLVKYFSLLKEGHGIDLDAHQKAWYVKKSEEQDQDMKQEYPSFALEAFRASGRPVFSLEKISRDIRRAKLKPHRIGFMGPDGRFREDKEGTLKIFISPDPKEAIAIGGDVAEGLEGGDYSATSGLNKKLQQVFTSKLHTDPDLFGEHMVHLARYYHDALLAPEINNHGHTTLSAIKRMDYFNIYEREVKEEIAEDLQKKVGWHTNVKTKMQMLDELKAAYRDDSIEINCEETLREMMTLSVEDNGDVVLNGKDRVVALAISLQAIRQAVVSGDAGVFETGGTKIIHKSLSEMLRHSEDNDESYFD